MRLHDLELSGNCYKVRLLLALLGIDYELRPVDFMAGEHKTDAFATMNAFREIPVLEDDGLILRDSQAILVYLARKFGGEAWLPTAADGMARVMEWLSTAANDIARGPNDARLHDKFGFDIDLELARTKAHRVLKILDDHLADREWLELGRPTIADIACFPYVALSHEGGVRLDEYPAVRAWIGRIKGLPGFVPMPDLA
jgi:glutathione S-transferase